MKVAVMGAGAVGCFFGALLQKAGHQVVLIGRPALVEAVRAQGLRLQMAGRDEYLPLAADTRPDAVQGAELVLFCVKSGDTEDAGAAIAPFLSPSCFVLSLQNGVGNAERLAAVLGRETVAAAVYVATEMAGPGHVLHHGRGELVIGPSAASEAMARKLDEAGIPTEVSARVNDALWAKLVVNCAYNALSAITQLPYGQLVQSEGIVASMRDVFDECAAVARAASVALPASLWDDVLGIARSMPGQRSSTAQDVARGKPSEIDFINGLVVREGARLGVATPVNRVLHGLVKLRDDAARKAH